MFRSKSIKIIYPPPSNNHGSGTWPLRRGSQYSKGLFPRPCLVEWRVASKESLIWATRIHAFRTEWGSHASHARPPRSKQPREAIYGDEAVELRNDLVLVSLQPRVGQGAEIPAWKQRVQARCVPLPAKLGKGYHYFYERPLLTAFMLGTQSQPPVNMTPGKLRPSHNIARCDLADLFVEADLLGKASLPAHRLRSSIFALYCWKCRLAILSIASDALELYKRSDSLCWMVPRAFDGPPKPCGTAVPHVEIDN